MKKALIAMTVVISFVLSVASAYAVEVFKSPTEVIQWDPSKAYNGYTAFNYCFVDMEGNLVHRWNLPEEISDKYYILGFPWGCRILENGNYEFLLLTAPLRPGGISRMLWVELGWDSEIVNMIEEPETHPFPK